MTKKIQFKRRIEKPSLISAIVFLLISLSLSSMSLTGKIISEEHNSTSAFVSTGFFILGITAVFLYFKIKRK